MTEGAENQTQNRAPNQASNQALLNRIWSQTLLEELTRFGVKHICIAPGSRSTPLTLEAQANNKLTIHTHFDERGLGFLALGMAKAGNEPVAVVVTSGTAVANLLPAIAESGLTGEKLIVLTADRPPELINCGANQAINQKGIFSTHVTGSLELPVPSTNIPLNWLLTSIDDCLYKQKELSGSVHINCPFPEPLYTKEDKSLYSNYTGTVEGWYSGCTAYISKIQTGSSYTDNAELTKTLCRKKGVIVVGNVTAEDAGAIKKLAEITGWPLLCDPQSGISSDWRYFDLWLQNDSARKALSECELILQFGARLVSKRLNAFIREQVLYGACCYWQVTDENRRLNPDHLPMTVFNCAPCLWVSGAWISELQKTTDKFHYQGWGDRLVCYPDKIAAEMEKSSELTELNLAYRFNAVTDTQNLFIGNSLIVRLLDMVGSPDSKQVFTNRGASGIDGLVATAMGVQKVLSQPLVVLLGDTSLLYDLNSLALAEKSAEPVVIIVTNNDGGAIFDLLPVPEQQREDLYQMPHGYDFKAAAAQFRLDYCRPDTLNELSDAVKKHMAEGQGTLLAEVRTPSQQASQEVKQLVSYVHALD